jgi:hypothetical protein
MTGQSAAGNSTASVVAQEGNRSPGRRATRCPLSTPERTHAWPSRRNPWMPSRGHEARGNNRAVCRAGRPVSSAAAAPRACADTGQADGRFHPRCAARPRRACRAESTTNIVAHHGGRAARNCHRRRRASRRWRSRAQAHEACVYATHDPEAAHAGDGDERLHGRHVRPPSLKASCPAPGAVRKPGTTGRIRDPTHGARTAPRAKVARVRLCSKRGSALSRSPPRRVGQRPRFAPW